MYGGPQLTIEIMLREIILAVHCKKDDKFEIILVSHLTSGVSVLQKINPGLVTHFVGKFFIFAQI